MPETGDAESWKLFSGLFDGTGVDVGGWLQLGAHSDSTDLFNSDPDRLNLHHAWLFAERRAASKDGALAFGFRFDALYGTDAGDTVSFGNVHAGGPSGWDGGDNFQTEDGYGFALPQAYVEVASGDLSVKLGHFYTLIGYEVVGAPGNFFYSHAITMYNSEPFTHTRAYSQVTPRATTRRSTAVGPRAGTLASSARAAAATSSAGSRRPSTTTSYSPT